jgi:AcrR family transcriptional regulator
MKKPVSAKSKSLFKEIASPELSKGDLRKLQILQAAIESLAKLGLARTNYESVGKLCGLKRPHVAYHYPDFDLLIEGCIKFAYATGRSVVAEYLRDAKGVEEQLTGYIEGTFGWLASNSSQKGALMVLWHLATFDKKYWVLNDQIKRMGTERVYAITTGGKPLDLKSAAWTTALGIHGLLIGRCIEFITFDSGLESGEIARQTAQQALALLPKKSSGK